MYQSLEVFKKEMKKHLKEYTTFLRGLPRRKLKGLSSKFYRLHKEAYSKIDCGQCANCCKVMTPTYTKSEVKRISAHVGMTEKEYWKKYLKKDVLFQKDVHIQNLELCPITFHVVQRLNEIVLKESAKA